MRTNRTEGNSTYYHVKDSSVIKNISLKDFLAHIETKAELASYLALKALNHSNSCDKLKKFMVTYETSKLQTHNHEEADTLLLLHASLTNTDAIIIINSPDTDVFLQIVNMHLALPVEDF